MHIFTSIFPLPLLHLGCFVQLRLRRVFWLLFPLIYFALLCSSVIPRFMHIIIKRVFHCFSSNLSHFLALWARVVQLLIRRVFWASYLSSFSATCTASIELPFVVTHNIITWLVILYAYICSVASRCCLFSHTLSLFGCPLPYLLTRRHCSALTCMDSIILHPAFAPLFFFIYKLSFILGPLTLCYPFQCLCFLFYIHPCVYSGFILHSNYFSLLLLVFHLLVPSPSCLLPPHTICCSPSVFSCFP